MKQKIKVEVCKELGLGSPDEQDDLYVKMMNKTIQKTLEEVFEKLDRNFMLIEVKGMIMFKVEAWEYLKKQIKKEVI